MRSQVVYDICGEPSTENRSEHHNQAYCPLSTFRAYTLTLHCKVDEKSLNPPQSQYLRPLSRNRVCSFKRQFVCK